ncbi:hypothetical protein BJX96DRAFT_170912 [Aspergillus floccosus]
MHFWNWGWTYQDISINNCNVEIDISTGGTTNASVGSITVFDSFFSNTPIAIKSVHSDKTNPHTAGSIILENISLENDNKYVLDGPERFQGDIKGVTRPAGLLDGNKYYVRSKSQYEGFSASSFASVREGGATGDGETDDTAALQEVIGGADTSDKVVFLDAGVYKVTKTLSIPAGARIVGEAFPVIMSSGEFFNSQDEPIGTS